MDLNQVRSPLSAGWCRGQREVDLVQTITVKVGPDGRVEIPGTRVGQIVTIQVSSVEDVTDVTDPLTPEEQAAVIETMLAAGKRVRAQLTPEELAKIVNHDEWLYGPDGLPK
jgi:hypothetical protein